MRESIYPVLVNWNLKDDTLACIDSLFASGVVEGRIIVVDHGSTDGSIEAIKEKYASRVHLIEAGENPGYAGGINRGMARALELGAEWVLIMNNDTEVAPSFLEEMEKGIKNGQGYTILAPMILYYDDPKRIWYLGDRLLPTTLITYSLYKNELAQGAYPDLIPVDFVSGCGMLVNKEVFERVGMFDTSYFMYGEEVDFCWRARLGGFRTVCVTNARMWHKVSMTANRDRPKTRYHRIRNQIWFYRRYAWKYQIPILFIFTILRALRMVVGDMTSRQYELLTPLGQGWRDGWFGRMAPAQTGR